jgi:CDP-2,3-bis-(O-geranylgeranyl)-sn-glycerol synthase
MVYDALFALWFLLPAAAANMAPILGAAIPYIKRWNSPIDGGKQFRGKDILGPHKTWRGFASGFIAASLVVVVQQAIVATIHWESLASEMAYLDLPLIVLAGLFTLGALGGDAAESFLKRQSGISSGNSWFPFDQIDYIIGTVIIMLPVIVLSLSQYVWIFVIWSAIHIAASYVGWLTGFKSKPI